MKRTRTIKSKEAVRELYKQILHIEKLQQYRENCPLHRYNKGDKVHLKQMEFHRCTKANRWVFGGNRTGKTECGAVETVWLALGIHPYRANRDSLTCYVVSLSKQVQRDVAQQKILYYLPPEKIVEIVMCEGRKNSPSYGIIDYLLVKNALGGLSKIIFKSCESGRDKFVGTALDFVWFDEEPPQDVYNECKMRLMDKNGFMFGTMTPLLGLTYVYNEIYLNLSNDREIWHVTMEWEDNPFLPPEQIKAFSANMSQSELETRRYGQFVSGSGLVYPEFDRRIHVIKPLVGRRKRQNTKTDCK